MDEQIIDKELKGMLVDMLSWFHGHCQENSLAYYVIGGTCLGAVRHQGFIPWDDDVDIGMPRKDYERLRETLQGDERYALETPYDKRKDFNYKYSKLYDTKTTLVENNRYRTKRGIYLDIFPLDGLGDDEAQAKKRFKRIKLRNYILTIRTLSLREGRSPIKNLAVRLGHMIPDCLVDNNRLILKMNDIARERDLEHSKLGGNVFGAWGYREIMPSDILGTPRLYRFEGLEVYGPEQADAYLTHVYGDWRQLPPEEKRVSHHSYLHMDLHRSYLEPDPE